MDTGRTDEVAEHHSEIAPLAGRFGRDRGRIRRCSRCSLRRYRRRCDGRRHRGVAQFGDGCKYFPAMPERDADVLEILIRQEAEYRDINFILGKALRVFARDQVVEASSQSAARSPATFEFPYSADGIVTPSARYSSRSRPAAHDRSGSCVSVEQASSVVYSITSSASCWRCPGTSRPSAFAALRLIISSYLVGACTGSSLGFSPRRIRST